MAPTTEGGSNGHGLGWRTPGNAVRAAVGGRRRSGPNTEIPTQPAVTQRATLQAIQERGGSLPPAPALLVLDDLLTTLEQLRAAGITHGHIRPAVVIVGRDGRCRLDDRHPARSPGSAASGLLGYVAPEVRAGRTATPQSDVYSATAVFLEALTNLPPLGGVDQARRDVSVPMAARGLLEEGLHPDPRSRPASPARLRADIAVVGDAFLEDDWRGHGRDWLSAAAAAIESGGDLAGAVHSPWARPRRPERDLPSASDARPAKPVLGAGAASPQPTEASTRASDASSRASDASSRASDASSRASDKSSQASDESSRAAATAKGTSAGSWRSARRSSRQTTESTQPPRRTLSEAIRPASASAVLAPELATPHGDGTGRRRRDQRLMAGAALGAAGLVALLLVAALVLHGTPARVPAHQPAQATAPPSAVPSPSQPVFGFSQQFSTPAAATPSPSPSPTPSATPAVQPGAGNPPASTNPGPAATPSPPTVTCFIILFCHT